MLLTGSLLYFRGQIGYCETTRSDSIFVQFLHIFWQTIKNTSVLSAQAALADCTLMYRYVVFMSGSVSATGICRLHPNLTSFGITKLYTIVPWNHCVIANPKSESLFTCLTNSCMPRYSSLTGHSAYRHNPA